ncbi:hypothetical protein DYB37_009232 [Aphanomyces astaci]|uniref:Calcineurin-like phosphoesterase domain-containing protein n=1 Tax=Aphanomyces astaci TaxID=112090 RepID=A0A418EBQ2_APHAT|nr:hypothetical protein DYB35_006085 [Aphanomyces astaci]RHZ10532.1 hypothetical protein DYB37_009232 [Aphanomyces astaci]
MEKLVADVADAIGGTLSPLQVFLALTSVVSILLGSACYVISMYSSPIALLVFGFVGYSLLRRLVSACGILSPQPHIKVQAPNTIRFVCISDTYGKHEHVKLPPGDVLIHAGNFTRLGTVDEVERCKTPSLLGLMSRRFNAWLGSQPYRRKLVVAGHHDNVHPIDWSKVLSHGDYLADSSVSIDGISVFGCASTSSQAIPTHTDVVVTHIPPFGILDKQTVDGIHIGSEALLKQILTTSRPKLHVFGRVREGYGQTIVGTTTFVNASSTTLCRQPANAPWVVDLPTPA